VNLDIRPRALRRDEPAPLRRELALPPGNTFLRCLTARVVGQYRGMLPVDAATALWPNDRVVAQLLTRAASAPAMSDVTGWAAELIHLVVRDALAALGPASAGGRLLASSTVLRFDDGGIISAPGFVASAANAGFVAEGDPIPVRQLAVLPAQMTPHKLAAIAVLSEEMLRSSSAEVLIGDTLIRSAAAALDVALFSTNGPTAAAPPGLRYNIAPLTASAAGNPWDAYFSDAGMLIDALAAVGGNGPYIVVASPGRGVEMRLRALGDEGVPYLILGSVAIGEDLLAVAPAAIVAAIEPMPQIELASATALHMNDASLPIVNGGAPAAPVSSMFQTDTIALKMRWRLSWALRSPAGIAWLTPSW
jgi:Phage capsid family